MSRFIDWLQSAFTSPIRRAFANDDAIQMFWALARNGRSCRLDVSRVTGQMVCVASVCRVNGLGLELPPPRLGVIVYDTVAYCRSGIVMHTTAFDKDPFDPTAAKQEGAAP